MSAGHEPVEVGEGQLALDFDGAPRSGFFRRRRTLVIAAALLPGVGVLGGVAAAMHTDAGAAPKTLQAVQVGLGSDGSIAKLSATNYDTSGGKSAQTTEVLDPRSPSSKLPVSVAVSYTNGTKVGTDLRQFQGAGGVVEMDVTVTNTTVSPHAFDDINYHTKSGTRYGLVATPLTVVATATLPKASVIGFEQPQTSSDGNAALVDGDAHTTNGLVGVDASGDPQVQWSAILAPPQLAPSTTFRLVVDASKFALSDLTVSVQPGLQTDTSLADILDPSTSDAAQRDQQQVALALVSQINTSLTATSKTLDGIGGTLKTLATTRGAGAVETLKANQTALGDGASTLEEQIKSLRSQVTDSINSGASTTSEQLDNSVRTINDYLGLASGAPVPTGPSATNAVGNGCAGTSAHVSKTDTLLDQLQDVADALAQIAADSTSCEQLTATALAKVIGTGTEDCSTPPAAGTDVTLFCDLKTTQSNISTASGAISTVIGNIAGDVNAGTGTVGVTQMSLDAARDSIHNVEVQVSSLQSALTSEYNDASQTQLTLGAQIAAAKEAVSAAAGKLVDLEASQAAVATSNPSPSQQVAKLQALASEAQLASADLKGAGGAADALAGLQASVCATPSFDLLDGLTDLGLKGGLQTILNQAKTEADGLSEQLYGVACDGSSAGPTAPVAALVDDAGTQAAHLTDGLATMVTTLTAIENFLGQLADGTAGLGSVTGNLASASASVAAAGNNVTAPPSDGIQRNAGIATGLNNLYTPGPAAATPSLAASCAVPSPATVIDQIQEGVNAIDCNRRYVAQEYAGAILNTVAPSLNGAAASVSAQASRAAGANADAAAGLGTLIGALQNEVQNQAKAEFTSGAQAIASQQGILQNHAASAQAAVSADAATAAAQLSSAAGDASKTSSDTSKALQTQIGDVIETLGSGTGETRSGLLDRVVDSSVQVNSGAEALNGSNDTVQGYNNYVLATQDVQTLASKETSLSLQAIRDIKPLGSMKFAAAHAVVYVFTLKG